MEDVIKITHINTATSCKTTIKDNIMDNLQTQRSCFSYSRDISCFSSRHTLWFTKCQSAQTILKENVSCKIPGNKLGIPAKNVLNCIFYYKSG